MDKVATEDDMAGTFLVCVMFGVLLMLRGKIEFGNIYGFGLTGCGAICLLINLLTPKGVYVQLYSTISIMGYCLLPFVFLAGSALFVKLLHPIGFIFGISTILWSSITATRLFEYSLEMRDQKYLIMYPIILFYCVFAILTVF
jgi:protein YIPF5/7